MSGARVVELASRLQVTETGFYRMVETVYPLIMSVNRRLDEGTARCIADGLLRQVPVLDQVTIISCRFSRINAAWKVRYIRSSPTDGDAQVEAVLV